MSEAFLKLVNMSISAGWLVLAVLAFRLILKKAPKWVNVLLWGIVAIRLICPFSIESALSLIPSTETISPEIMMDWTPEISTGIETLDQVVNPVISTSFAPEPSASANPLQILIPVAANLWLLGVLVMLLYTAVSYISLRLKLRTAVILRENIFQCETVHSPFVLGILKPKIYMPYTIDGVNLHHVVAHEQAHIRRFDHWWKPLGFLLLTVYWFNPLMWVAYILLCRDIELACDEKAIAELGSEQRADYTQALVACSVNRRMIAACPLAFGEVGVKERVKSIMNYRKPAFWVVILALITCVTVAVCFLTDPIDPTEDTLETDGMQMHQVSFPYATEEGYNLLIGADGVKEIQVSLSDSGGGVVNADESFFKKGEKVYLEPLQGITDLRGLSITALGKNGEILYAMSIPEDASMEDVINTVGSDGWLLAPTEHIVGPAIAGKTYVYENEGIIGSFTITLYEDGTFSYYEGNASSYFGVGTWQLDGSIVTITDDEELGYPLVNKFIMDGDDLVFAQQDSSNFIYVKVKEGERFHCTGEAFKNADSVISPEQSVYPFKPTMEELTDQLHELQGLQAEQESSAESTYYNSPALTITYREESIEEPRIGLLNWEYTKEDGTKETVMGDGTHPLDAKHSSPFLTLDPYVDEPFEIWLHWDLMPDSVLVRYWDESSWGKLETEPAGRILVKEKNKAGNAFCFEPKEENCIYEVLATWDNDPNYSGKVYYNFYAVITDRELTVQELYKEYASTGDKGSHIYVDLDEDGVEELFIYRSGRTSEIATISEGKVVTVMASSHLFLCDGGIIGRYSEGGGGRTMFYYRIENQAAVIADVIVNTFQDDAWYRSTDPNSEYASPENMTRITKEEAYEVSKQYAIAEENIPSKPDCTTWLYGEE